MYHFVVHIFANGHQTLVQQHQPDKRNKRKKEAKCESLGNLQRPPTVMLKLNCTPYHVCHIIGGLSCYREKEKSMLLHNKTTTVVFSQIMEISFLKRGKRDFENTCFPQFKTKLEKHQQLSKSFLDLFKGFLVNLLMRSL